MHVTPFRALVLLAVLGAVAVPGTAYAAPPANDNFANATTIAFDGLPFTDSVPTHEATIEPGEPTFCSGAATSVWYTITPSETGALRAAKTGTAPVQFVSAYRQTASGLAGLTQVACSPYYDPNSLAFTASAGETYYLQVGTAFAWASGSIGLRVERVLPPANDDFATATEIGSLPFADTADTTASTAEPGEPSPSCAFTPLAGSVWYRYTPSANGSVTADTFGSMVSAALAAYSGDSLATLSPVGCRASGRLTVRVEAGRTYAFLVGGMFGGRGRISFHLAVAPDPIASWSYAPGDPSIFDTVAFFDGSFDPGEVGIESRTWNFGDGSGSTEQYPQHRFPADGSYDVTLTVTTPDGRSASRTQTVNVTTHDVTIAKVTVPQTAGAGQTRSIAVGLTNDHLPETVEVSLYRSTPGGWHHVGSSTQFVPVRGASRTTAFAFNYTFTADDAAIGKVSFQAVATIQGARDALPSDNVVISLPTKVHG